MKRNKQRQRKGRRNSLGEIKAEKFMSAPRRLRQMELHFKVSGQERRSYIRLTSNSSLKMLLSEYISHFLSGAAKFLDCLALLGRAIEGVRYEKFNEKSNGRVNHALMGGCSSTERPFLLSDEIWGLAREPAMSHPAARYYFLTFARSGFVNRSQHSHRSTLGASHYNHGFILGAGHYNHSLTRSALSRSTGAAVRG